jgi:hypothetical protein
MEDFIGLKRRKNLQTINWVAHIPDNNYIEYTKWVHNAKKKLHYVKRMHFKYEKNGKYVHRYVLVESCPVFNENGDYLGLRGVFLNLPKNIWEAFNDEGGLIIDNEINDGDSCGDLMSSKTIYTCNLGDNKTLSNTMHARDLHARDLDNVESCNNSINRPDNLKQS